MWLIADGTLIDGTGAPRRPADVLIEGDRIAAIEPPGGIPRDRPGFEVIDARGKIVAPGFVDTHNHSDGWLLKIPHMVSKTTQGFTTEVLMSDGISYAPVSADTVWDWFVYLRSLNGLEVSDYRGWESIADYLQLLDGQTAQNVVAQVPYANLRSLAKGWDRSPPDDTQMRNIKQWLVEGMEQGAAGVSTGLDYVCQCFATTDELAEACAALRPSQGLYVSHIRYKKGLLPALAEAVEIGRRAGIPVHISHLKTDDPRLAEQVLDYIDRVATQEVDFTFDVYPYMPGSTMLHFLLPYDVWEQGPLAVVRQLASPHVRRNFRALLESPIRSGLDEVHLAWVPGKDKQRWLGCSLGDYVRRSGKPPELALCELLVDEHLAALGVFSMGDDALVAPFLQHDRYMIGSDGIFFPDGQVHPRQYGSAPRIVGPMVRQRKLFSLESAVRKLSGYPAERFGLTDRGVLREGAFADVVVFDAEVIGDRATYENPHQLSVGVEQLLVNGTPVLRDGQPTEATPGRALRFRG